MIELVDKLPLLDHKLIELLESLNEDDWHKPTVAKLWTVKDVAAHLLDGNIRILSGLRDGYSADSPQINSYQDLLDYLNQLNADWVQAMKRVSPGMLIELHKQTGAPFYHYYKSLDPLDTAVYSVAWAGENESKNWMHIAREYTEKFLHQQQIRDAVGKQEIMCDVFYLPFLDVCMYALPHALREVRADEGSIVQMNITGAVSGTWWAVYDGKSWQRQQVNTQSSVTTEVSIDYYVSWKLFSKSRRPEDLRDHITIKGNQQLGEKAAAMVSFMA